VYYLADSLDGILAACEDLLGEHIEPGHLLRLELAAITHVLQARRYIEDLDAAEPVLIDQCVLFLAGTTALDLEHLRSGRSLHPQPPTAADLWVSESYLVGRRLRSVCSQNSQQRCWTLSRLTSCSTKTGMIQ